MDILIHGGQEIALPLTMILTAFSLVIIAFGMLMGAWRGVHRSFVRIGTLVISAVAAFILALPTELVPLDALHTAIADAGLNIIQATVDMEHLLDGYIMAFAAPFVFLVLFLVFSVISYIIYLILGFAIFPRKKYKKNANGERKLKRHRLFGMLVGGLCSIIVVACVNLPFYGFSNFILNDLGDVLVALEDKVEFKDTHGVSDVISEITMGDKLFDKLTTANMYGYHVSLHEDARDLVSTAMHAYHAFSTPVSEWDDHAMDDARFVFNSAKDSKALSTVLALEANILHDAMLNGEILGEASIPAEFKSIIAELLEKLSDNDAEEYAKIIETTKDVFFVFVDGMQRNGATTVTTELVFTDHQLLAELLDAVLAEPAFDFATVSALEVGLKEMTKQLGLKDNLKVDTAAWANATAEERAAEAKFLAETIPLIVSVEENENGEGKLVFSGATNAVKFSNSILVGTAMKQTVRSLAANLLASLKTSEKNDTPTDTPAENPTDTPADTPTGDVEDTPSTPDLPDDIIDATEGKTQEEVIESIPDIIVEGGLSQEVVDALPDIVKDVELDEDSANTLQQVVDELGEDKELVDAIPDYLREFLEKNGIVIPEGTVIPDDIQIPNFN